MAQAVVSAISVNTATVTVLRVRLLGEPLLWSDAEPALADLVAAQHQGARRAAQFRSEGARQRGLAGALQAAHRATSDRGAAADSASAARQIVECGAALLPRLAWTWARISARSERNAGRPRVNAASPVRAT